MLEILQGVGLGQVNMLFASTTISNGACMGVVTATGMATEIGAIQETSLVLMCTRGTTACCEHLPNFPG